MISTPALFELPQSHATARAGRLAGLERGRADPGADRRRHRGRLARRRRRRGTWLVFDLGGGTLDVSLLETRTAGSASSTTRATTFSAARTWTRAVRLGDAAARSRRGAAAASAVAGAPATGGGRWRGCAPPASRPRSSCRARTRAIAVPDLDVGDGARGDLELPIARDELDALTAPFVARSLTAVRACWPRTSATADDVARVVLVGGPTLMPALRARVGGMFDGRIAAGVDPMTIVARGAALYAGSVGLDATPAGARAPAAAAGLAVRIEHPSVTADLEPFVVGRCLPGVGPDAARRGFASSARTAAAAARRRGSGQVRRRAVRRRELRRPGAPGAEPAEPVPAFARSTAPAATCALATRAFAIVHGVSIGDPPLARAIGVARADDSTQSTSRRGRRCRRAGRSLTRRCGAIAAGSDDDALAVPIVQGESSARHRNRLIGMLQLARRSRAICRRAAASR